MASDGGFGMGPWDWLLGLPVLGAIFGAMWKFRAVSKGEIERLRQDHDALSSRYEAHRVEVANMRASNAYVAEVEARMAKSIDRIDEQMNGHAKDLHKRINDMQREIGEKLDRLIENGRRK